MLKPSSIQTTILLFMLLLIQSDNMPLLLGQQHQTEKYLPPMIFWLPYAQTPQNPNEVTPTLIPTLTPTPSPVAYPPPYAYDMGEPQTDFFVVLINTQYDVPFLGIITVAQLLTGFALLLFGVFLSIVFPVILRRHQAKQTDLAYQFNPYLTEGAITTPTLFFGRGELLNSVLTNIHTHNIAIYGAPQQGKSSLMLQLTHQLGRQIWADYHIIPVLLDLADHRQDTAHQAQQEKTFFATLIERTLHTLQQKRLPIPDTLHIHQQPDRQHYTVLLLAEDMQQIRQMLDTRPGRPLRLVLLIDDGDFLNEYTPTTLATFATFFTEHANEYMRCILCRGDSDKRVWQVPSPPWQGMFTIEHHLGLLTSDEAKRLITDPVPNYHYEQEAIRAIIAAGGLDPQRTQRICKGAVAAMLATQKKGRITHQHVEQAIATMGKS